MTMMVGESIYLCLHVCGHIAQILATLKYQMSSSKFSPDVSQAVIERLLKIYCSTDMKVTKASILKQILY